MYYGIDSLIFCNNFLKICSHEGYMSVIFILCNVLESIWYHGFTGLIKWVGKCVSYSILWHSGYKVGIISSFLFNTMLVKLPGPGGFFCSLFLFFAMVIILITNSMSLVYTELFPIFSSASFSKLFLKILSLSCNFF